ncbi:MAG: BACON domain-containing carbohydrate-binding protein [Bacteroidetes bacterium]|nr:BACON domain-containing carbohydrate-binding protein [Bacteroidota bacterium]
MKKGYLFLSLLVLCASFLFGQNNVVGPIVQTPVYFDVSPPLRDMVKYAPSKADLSWKDGIVKNKFNVRPRPVGQAPGGFTDPGLQIMNGTTIEDTTIVNFDGNTNTEGYYPPDTHGDVSPNYYFQVVNCHYSIYSKTGTLVLGPNLNSSVFTGMPNNTNSGDAVVLYDEQADRWLFSQFSLPSGGGYYQMIAVSVTNDPTGSWSRYEYSFTNMPDYPKFGVWGDAYYMSMHQFAGGATWAGCGAVAYNRSLMLAGSSAPTMIMFTKPASDEAFGWLPSDCDGPFPSGNPPNYFLYSYDGASNDHLGIYEFHVDWVTTSNSTFTNFLSLPVNAFTANMTGVSQQGTAVKLDVINDRMMYRLQYRSFAGYSTMVCNHTVDITTTQAGIRWYELRKTTGAWSIFQQGTYSIADGNSRWMGSIAMDSSGNMALGYSVSGTSLYPSIRYTGRRKNDALNTMTIAERGIYNGSGSQTGTANRWGDYSALSCDPSAKATYWYTTEYYATTSGTGWKTRIASFRWANTPVVATLPATSVTSTGGTLNGTVNPSGLSTTYLFNWGTTTSYGSNTTVTSAGSGTSAVNVSAPLTGLVTGTTYHYRITATNADGTASGVDMTFTPGAAIVITTAASSITQTTATAGGNVTTDGGSSVSARGTCWATTANPTIAGSHTTDGTGTGTFTSSLTGLSSNTTYHHRAYATNGAGTVYGSDLTFTTSCGIVNTLPFTEGFEALATTPACWSEENSNPAWQYIAGDGNGHPAAAHTGARNACLQDATAADNKNKLMTPVMDLSGYTNVVLTFWHTQAVWTGDQDQLAIYYKTSAAGAWVLIQSYTASVTAWTQRTLNLPSTGSYYQVAFEGNAKYGYGVCLDDINISGTPTGNYLTVTPPNQNVPATPAGSTAFTVTSNTSWTVVSDQTWCTVTPSGTGNGTITANYTVNTFATPRVANITTSATGVTPVVVTVTQAGATPTLSVTPSNQNVPATPAGSTAFTVTSNTSWNVVSDQTWCTVNTSGTGNGTITANYTINTLTTPRVANITTSATGCTPVIVTVTQAGATPTLAVTPPNQNVPASPAGSTAFTVTSNTSWNVVSDQTWCTVNTSGTGNGTITANYTVNTLTTPRVANITTSATGCTPVIVTVTQAGAAATLTVTPPNQNVPATPAGTTNFTVTSNTSWTVISDQTWCTVTPSGSGNGTIVATYTENLLVTPRVANITTSATGVTPVVVTVTQAGATPTLAVTPPNQNVPASPAGVTTFTVTSNTSWNVVSDQTWCTVNTSGTGNGTITANYTVNTLSTQRVANITTSATGCTPVIVTVTQAGTAPSLTVSPSNQDVSSAAGSTSFTVTTTATTWYAVSDSPWCTVTPTGSGNGTIIANYTENTNTSGRIATITVSASGFPSQTATVTQAGAAPTLAVDPPNQNVTSTAGSTSFSVTSNSSWTATSDQTWCTPTPSGTGNGNIDASYTDNVSSSQRQATLTVVVSGVAPVMVTVTQAGTVGVDNHQGGTLQIIPNPASGLFQIVSGIAGKIDQIDILDLTGRTILSRKCKNDNDYQFDLSAEPQGCYFVKVKINGEIMVRRLVISK